MQFLTTAGERLGHRPRRGGAPRWTGALPRQGVFGAVQDSVLAPENNGWPAGAYPYLWTAAAPRLHRTLLGFDTTIIPPGATVTSATVSLVESWNRNFNPIRVHEVLNPWNEATVTWANFGSPANFSPTVIASFAGGGGGTKTFDITPLAAAWVDGTADNNGILLEEDLVAGGSLHSFASSEWDVAASRPSLEICYDFWPIPSPKRFALAVIRAPPSGSQLSFAKCPPRPRPARPPLPNRSHTGPGVLGVRIHREASLRRPVNGDSEFSSPGPDCNPLSRHPVLSRPRSEARPCGEPRAFERACSG